MGISNDELKHIAALSKLDIDESDFNNFKSQFEKVLSFIDQLKEVDVSDISAVSVGHINNEVNNWRADDIHSCDDETKEAILKEAPEIKNGYVKVPGVFES